MAESNALQCSAVVASRALYDGMMAVNGVMFLGQMNFSGEVRRFKDVHWRRCKEVQMYNTVKWTGGRVVVCWQQKSNIWWCECSKWSVRGALRVKRGALRGQE